MSSISSPHHNHPPSVSSIDTHNEHDDLSVTASDDIEVDIRSTSTATDPSLPEHEQSLDEKSSSILNSSKPVSPSMTKGPVLLLRRQPTSGGNTPNKASLTSDARQSASPASRNDSGTATPVREVVDPSLLEAFANPMNRQYLLQLEETLNNFVTQSRTDTMELPPMNSFYRCLAHKMADHYKLQHVAESGHVVLFRCQYAKIPETRLSELSKRTTASSTSSEDGQPPPSSTPEFRQIMKRVPVATRSTAEDDTKSESSQSQVLSHEERQAVYEKTRARIFSDYVESQMTESLPSGKTDDGESETQSKREDSLQRSDDFQTRQQFARETGTAGSPHSSYAAALTGQQPFQSPSGGIAYPYPPGSYAYQYPPGYQYAMSQSSRDPVSGETSRPESRTSSPSNTRNDSPGFHPNPFAREFVPTGSGNTRQQRQPMTPPVYAPPSVSATVSRNSTPPATVKKTSSFENRSRPITPTPAYARSQSATSMRPTPSYIPAQPTYAPYPPPYPSYPPQAVPTLPFGAYISPNARQYEWGTPITTGTVRYISNGQHIAPQILPYRAHPMPMPPKQMFVYGSPQGLNGIVNPMAKESEVVQSEIEKESEIHEQGLIEGRTDEGNGNVSTEKVEEELR